MAYLRIHELYCTHIRPLLEYASEVTDVNRLDSLFSETGWETLAERRRSKNLIVMYENVNNDAPSYLIDLLFSRVENVLKMPATSAYVTEIIY